MITKTNDIGSPGALPTAEHDDSVVLPAPHYGEDLVLSPRELILGASRSPDLPTRMLLTAANARELLQELPAVLSPPGSEEARSGRYSKAEFDPGNTAWIAAIQRFKQSCAFYKALIFDAFVPLMDLAKHERSKAPENSDQQQQLGRLVLDIHRAPKIFDTFANIVRMLEDGVMTPCAAADAFGLVEMQRALEDLPHASLPDYPLRAFYDGCWNPQALLSLLNLEQSGERKPTADPEQEMVGLQAGLAQLAAALTRSGQEISFFGRYDQIFAPLQVPRFLLTTVVRELLDNAHDEKVRTKGNYATLLELSRDGDKAVIAVMDRGPGLSPEVLAAWGEPITTKRPGCGYAHCGSGQGLLGSINAVEAYGGRVELLSSSSQRVVSIKRGADGAWRMTAAEPLLPGWHGLYVQIRLPFAELK